MPNKQLTAKVRLDASQAHKTIDKLITKIKKINEVVNKPAGTSGLEKKIEKAILAQEKLKQATLKTKLAEERLTTQKNKSAVAGQKVNEATVKTQIAEQRLAAQTARTTMLVERLNATKAITVARVNNISARVSAWWTKQKALHSTVKSTNRTFGSLLSKVKAMVGTYLGLQTLKLGVNTSDIITSAENRLNNIEGGNPKLTAESLDKMYAAAQRSRSAYADMLGNVSKTMALAGDSFQGNIDNAIRFQEIMSKAYTIGGASETEKATSMYQLVQALGSGILQGDELRSVREGAPIAYKKIEEFAQGVFNTEESLKDMASQGVITSDIIVAAIMGAEDEITKSFENTEMTFAQAWDNIKNMATKAFEPTLQKLNDVLNSDAGQRFIEGIGVALVVLGNILWWVISIFGSFFNWCSENWNWLKYIVIGVIGIIISLIIRWAVVTVVGALVQIAAWIAVHWQMVLIYLTIGLLVSAIVWLANTAVSGCEFIVYALLMVAVAIALIAVVTQMWWLLWVALVIALVALFLAFADKIVGAVYWLGAVCYNIGMGIANFFVACWNWVLAAGHNAIAGIGNVAIALGNSIGAICTNIGVAFNNAWHGALSGFWNFVASCMEGLDWLSKPISKIAELFGKSFNYEDFTASIRSKADAHDSKMKDYVSVSDAWNSGMNTYQYKDLGDAWSSGMNTFEYKDLGEAYNKGAQIGDNIQNKVGEWGSNIKNKISGITSALSGVELGGLPDPNDPALGLGDAYDPSGANDDILKGLDELNGTTDDINDKMDLTDDDFEYLRKIAEMEWRNEFTTAEIKIDMTNNNTVNGDRDLDGIVEYLSDVLRSEMTSVANGVHY